jgi:predicted nucleotidyltransferase
MDKTEIRSRISACRDELDRLGVSTLAVFGSFSRDEAGPDSDVDVLVRFADPASFDRYMDLKFLLERVLERKVDLVTDAALRPELRERIERELVRVA